MIMEQVIGYIMVNGCYDHKYYFEGSHEKMAAFILMHPYEDVIITDGLDCILITAKATYIDQCVVDRKFEFLHLYSKIQIGEITYGSLRFRKVGMDMVET